MKKDSVTVDYLIEQYITGGKEAVKKAMSEGGKNTADEVTFTDLNMDSLDVVQLAVKVQDDLGIRLADDEFTKVPAEGEEFKPTDKVNLGDIAKIINDKLTQK